MKKFILVLVVLVVFGGVVYVQSSVIIYGVVDVSLFYINKIFIGGKDMGGQMVFDFGLMKGLCLGVKGVEDLGGGIKVLFIIENGFSVDIGEVGQKGVLWGCQVIVGLLGNFGMVLVGCQNDILGEIGGISLVGDFGGVVSCVYLLNLDCINGECVNNFICYNILNFGGFSGSVIYGFGE